MALLELLKSNPDAAYQLELPQVIAICGNGRLLDNSQCSSEFRDFLRQAPSSKLESYASSCLIENFDRSGMALQDVVNELGRRLDYQVSGGLYQGRKDAIGFDGIWSTPTKYSLVVEVKTTDAYRINLDTIATYRQRLIENSEISDRSSILIVVGRQNTGDLEAQVRGSRHAWDVRLISVDALVKLVKLKEETEEDTSQKIWDVLTPFEYTRVDRIIDIAFAAAVEANETSEKFDAEQTANLSFSPVAVLPPQTQAHTPQDVLERQRKQGLTALGKRLGCTFVRRSRATYWSPDEQHKFRVASSVSKRHTSGYYWYAYHPAWDEFLGEAKHSAFLLSCVDQDSSYALPVEWLRERLPQLNQTQVSPEKSYWHIHLQALSGGRMGFKVHKTGEMVDISDFEIS